MTLLWHQEPDPRYHKPERSTYCEDCMDPVGWVDIEGHQFWIPHATGTHPWRRLCSDCYEYHSAVQGVTHGPPEAT